MCSPTRAQLLLFIELHPGVTTQEIANHFSESAYEYPRTYHCIRVKVRAMADRGDIRRFPAHTPGKPAHWYSEEVE